MPTFDLEPGRRLRFRAGDVPNGLSEGPDMTFRVVKPIGPVAVELLRRFLQNDRAGGAGTAAMRVKSVGQVDMDQLRILAAERSRTGSEIGPFRTDHDV